MRRILSVIFSTLIYIYYDKSGEVNISPETQAEKQNRLVSTDEIEIGGVFYRITAEFRNGVDFDKTLAEWALRKVVDEMKTVA